RRIGPPQRVPPRTSYLPVASLHLLSRGRCERRLAPLAIAHIDDLRRLTDLQDVQRVRVVVDVGDGLSGDLYDDVALLQTSLFRGAAAHHASEQQPLDVAGVVGNRAGEDPHTRAAAARLQLLLDLRELGRIVRVLDPANDRRREIDDAIEILVVDLVRRVRRLVIVGVRAGEETEI